MQGNLLRVWTALLLLGFSVPSAQAQTSTDTLAYELVQAAMDGPPREGWIVVAFGESMPQEYLTAGDQALPAAARQWVIEVRDRSNPATLTLVHVSSVYVAADPAQNRIVALQPAQAVDAEKQFIRVRLLTANFPEVVVAEVKKTGAAALYGPAKGKDDADLYFKGIVLAAPGSGPTYSIDAKAGHSWRLSPGFGSAGLQATYVVDKASRVGPDSITAEATYSKVWVMAPGTGLILDVDAVGFEFDSENDTRNLTSAATGQLVLPPVRLATASHAALDFVAGYEAGRNQRNEITSEPLGGFMRTVIGGNGYLLLKNLPLFRRIDVHAAWKVRLLSRAEPFTPAGEGDVATLTDDPRQIVTLAVDLMVNKGLGFSVGYSHGSEPPKFEQVRHRTEVGLVVKFKQVNKG